MTNADPLPAAVLSRKAVVYVRQSTQTQGTSPSREPAPPIRSRRRRPPPGFSRCRGQDDDLGRSASGTVARPRFERLVASLCAGEVGAVICFDASRLSRNGRDWHHLLELCGLVGARVIDPDGVYDPCRPNDRLLLGMKGSISEFELASCDRGCWMPRARRPQKGTQDPSADRLCLASGDRLGPRSGLRISAKSAGDSGLKSATHSD